MVDDEAQHDGFLSHGKALNSRNQHVGFSSTCLRPLVQGLEAVDADFSYFEVVVPAYFPGSFLEYAFFVSGLAVLSIEL